MESEGQQYVFSMESDGYQFGKFLGAILVTTSVAKVVREVIQNNVVDETFRDGVQIKIASFVIGGMVCEKVWNHTETKIDHLHQIYVKAQKEWADAKNPEPIKVDNLEQ